MLTASQVQVVAFEGPDGPICEDCARDQFGTIAVSRVLERLEDEPHPIIAYSLSEYATQEAESWSDYAEAPDGMLPNPDHVPAVDCANCGRELEEAYGDAYVRPRRFRVTVPVIIDTDSADDWSARQDARDAVARWLPPGAAACVPLPDVSAIEEVPDDLAEADENADLGEEIRNTTH